MGENGGVEELFKKFIAEVGSPGIFSRKATREKYLREAISWGYKGRESEIAKQQAAATDKAIVEIQEKTVDKPAITPRELSLEQEARYQKTRTENAVEALMKTITDFKTEKAALVEEIAKREKEAQVYMEKTKQMKEKIKRIIEIVE